MDSLATESPPRNTNASLYKFMPLSVHDFLLAPEMDLLSAEQVGALVLLMLRAWVADPPCTLPDDDRALARLSRLDSRWKRIGAPLLVFFPLTKGGRRTHAGLLEAYGRVDKTYRGRAKGGGNSRKGESDDHPAEKEDAPNAQ